MLCPVYGVGKGCGCGGGGTGEGESFEMLVGTVEVGLDAGSGSGAVAVDVGRDGTAAVSPWPDAVPVDVFKGSFAIFFWKSRVSD